MSAFCNLFTRLKRNRAGNFGVLTAILLVPLLSIVGLALDLTRAAELKTRIQSIADAAILSSLNHTSIAQRQRGAVGYNYTDPSWARSALAEFNAQVKILDPKLSVVPELVVQKKGNILQSDLKFKTTIRTSFLKVLSINEINISGNATAVYNGAIFKDFYMLVDNSPSMGIGATTADINLLKAKVGCAFACHTLDGVLNNYPKAAATGAKLRIDTVRLGLKNVAEAVQSTRSQADIYRVALFALGVTAQTAVTSKIEELTPLTSDMSAFTTSGQYLGLMSLHVNNYNNFSLTDLNSAMGALNSRIAAPGDGTSVNQAEKYVILITDGVQDRWPVTSCKGYKSGTRCTDYIYEQSCAALKSRGVKVAVLYTTYTPMTDDSYIKFVKPFESQIPVALRACASSGLFFEVSADQGIPEAMETLFATLTAAPVISQ